MSVQQPQGEPPVNQDCVNCGQPIRQGTAMGSRPWYHVSTGREACYPYLVATPGAETFSFENAIKIN